VLHPPIWLEIIGALAALVVFLVVPRRLAASRAASAIANEQPLLIVVGGGYWMGPWWWPVGASWPFVRLEVFAWGVRVGPNFRWVTWAIPTTELTWSEIASAKRTRTFVRLTRRSLARAYIYFGSGYGGLWKSDNSSLVSALRAFGVDVQE